MTAIEDFWSDFHKLEPSAKLGGIYANKKGYHNKRMNLPSTDYSVAQFAKDRVGPKDEASGIDITFPDAQRGDYSTIAKYSRRLLAAGKAKDPRTVYFREFFGNVDSDREVEGYDFTKERPASSDSSHLWHIHVSWHRAYIRDTTARHALMSILKGETIAAWNAARGGAVPQKPKPIDSPGTPFPGPCSNVYKRGNKPYGGVKQIQARLRQLGYKVTVDGIFGPITEKKIRHFQDEAGLAVDGIVGCKTWARLFS